MGFPPSPQLVPEAVRAAPTPLDMSPADEITRAEGSAAGLFRSHVSALVEKALAVAQIDWSTELSALLLSQNAEFQAAATLVDLGGRVHAPAEADPPTEESTEELPQAPTDPPADPPADPPSEELPQAPAEPRVRDWAAELPRDAAVVAFDTETTGLRGVVIQLGWVALDAQGVEVASRAELVQPIAGWPIEEGAFSVHGISTEALQRDGVPGESVLSSFVELHDELVSRGVPLVAHNASFDAGALARTAQVLGIDFPRLKTYCTMQKMSRNYTKRRFGRSRTMTNKSLYETLTSQVVPEEGLHDALVDARLTAMSYIKGEEYR